MQSVVYGFINGSLFGINVLRRGEFARAGELLSIMQRHLLWMARLLEGPTAHWPTPSRLLERELSPESYARFAACTAPQNAAALWSAYRTAWVWRQAMMADLGARHGVGVPERLCARIASLAQEASDS